MPITKIKRLQDPLWKESDLKAQKNGLLHSVYSVNGDVYTGEWKDNKKTGKGSISSRDGNSVYHGDWKNDMRHGHGILSVKRGSNKLTKEYAGGWKCDKRHGFGTRYYPNGEYYEGEWYGDKKSGWGRMFYQDGSVYEGEWFDDKRNGEGMLRLPNENRYDGKWENDMKNGDGKFFYLDKGHLYVGVWKDNIAKCGTFEDFGRADAPNPTAYKVPRCHLVDLDNVVEEASSELIKS